jgi:putative transposase
LTITKTAFEKVYRAQKDVRVKERMLLVLNVVYYGKIAAHVTREIHKSKAWACQWLKRYKEKGLEGLMNRPKGGRHPQVSRQIEYRIKTILKESNHGWTTKQVEEIIIQESGVRYHHNYIYRILRKWGFKQKVPKKVHVNTASIKEKNDFKKRPVRYLWVRDIKRKDLPLYL